MKGCYFDVYQDPKLLLKFELNLRAHVTNVFGHWVKKNKSVKFFVRFNKDHEHVIYRNFELGR